MDEKIKETLSNEYNLSISSLNSMKGGYFPDETYLLISSDDRKYVIKYIKYSQSFEHLQSILEFQNVLCDIYKYPCSKIILSINQQIVIQDNNRFFFVQTFVEGIEPTKEILDKDDNYLKEMGRLLAQWRIASHIYSSNIEMKEEEFTDKWWNKQQINTTDSFLLSNFVSCKQYLINLNPNFDRGLIHNDFHTNNSIVRNDGKIFIIDFVDASKSLFVADLATSLFHILVDKQNGEHRAKIFLQGYQQLVSLTLEEINLLDIMVRFKLTLSIIEDLRNSNDTNDSFIQSCFHLLHRLNNHSTLIKNLL